MVRFYAIFFITLVGMSLQKLFENIWNLRATMKNQSFYNCKVAPIFDRAPPSLARVHRPLVPFLVSLLFRHFFCDLLPGHARLVVPRRFLRRRFRRRKLFQPPVLARRPLLKKLLSSCLLRIKSFFIIKKL